MNKRLFDECDEKCLRDEPAACTARCPVHVDIAALAEEISKGDYKAAYKALEKRLPFAGIIGMVCDRPCESACVREMPVRVSELEKAAVLYGHTSQKKVLALAKNKGRVAVVGGGISGLSAAYELNRKGYNVTVYEQSERIGGRLWGFEGKGVISARLIEDELSLIGKMGVRILYGERVRKSRLPALIAEYDAVYIGTGAWEDYLAIDPITFQVSSTSLFAGGRLLGSDSVIESVSTGKRAAMSVERYIQKNSMTASREREGAFDTPMRYNTQDVPVTKATALTGEHYTKDEAAAEARRCLRCRCDECVRACVHMRKYNIAPKAYARQILINDGVILGTRYANTMINSCAMCGLCGEQCPHGINMRDIISETRQRMVETEKMPPSAHDFALRDMEFCAGNSFFTVKPPPEAHAQATGYMFYPGCQLPASAPEHVEAAYKYLLNALAGGVGLMLGCCGAPADWAGRRELAAENVRVISEAWANAGKPVFILACTSCMAVFERYLPQIEVLSLWEVIEQNRLPKAMPEHPHAHVLEVHDACGARHKPAVRQSVRKIVTDLGYGIKELKYAQDKAKCCGYGGLVFYANREQANDFADDRINESSADLLVYCAMCKDLFISRGKRAYHVLDLLFAAEPEQYALKPMPGLSERRMNRAALKRRLLRELWHEDMEAATYPESALVFTRDVLDKMEERLILKEDIADTLAHSRDSGQRFFNPETGVYLASLRKKNVTYWVQWTEQAGGAHIVGAYSHRMHITQ